MDADLEAFIIDAGQVKVVNAFLFMGKTWNLAVLVVLHVFEIDERCVLFEYPHDLGQLRVQRFRPFSSCNNHFLSIDFCDLISDANCDFVFVFLNGCDLRVLPNFYILAGFQMLSHFADRLVCSNQASCCIHDAPMRRIHEWEVPKLLTDLLTSEET